jgi:hypothetical protein
MVINFTAILAGIFIWRENTLFYGIAALVSLFFGMAIGRLEDLVVLLLVSFILASFATIVVAVSPALVVSNIAWVQVEIGALGVLGAILSNMLFVVPLSIMSGIFGVFLSDRYLRIRRSPFLS